MWELSQIVDLRLNFKIVGTLTNRDLRLNFKIVGTLTNRDLPVDFLKINLPNQIRIFKTRIFRFSSLDTE
ncbi:hypothetical protein G436_1446 [Leptospira interrogans serovar Hardjo str. Norma]|uniref:Uncharacterized protein n=1 Tax=Leptospira interrogans serovar Hardjo str. Norma TaxID=1279460 RepID=A0A0M4N7J7_LEPIR|nr:hypothetical protein G436_1446 [Leptospira interrogans serovar Hardjo str. Norma]